HVRAGDRVATGDALIDFDLDLLVREAPAVITPILLVESEGYQITNRASVGPILVGAPLMMVHEVASAEGKAGESADIDAATESRILRIDLPHGIHARPAARIAACARAFGASITIGKDARTASALSPTGLLALGIGHGDTITLAAQGS
ncbi:HPr family phosphocarrier protein, partial [Klebsiella pneumoniae]|uniref:HPr family phosphocarrier protein n=1 Tax=Klebsiella pneumoniae TaxID=573 RepID=UPI001874194C